MAAPVVLVGKQIVLKFGTVTFTEQTTSAAVVAEPQVDTITNTVGTTIDIDKGTKYTLKLSAMQDWTAGAAGLFGLLAAAYDSAASVAFTMTLAKGAGVSTVTGTVSGRRGDFGGDSAALLSDLELPILTITGPTYTTVLLDDEGNAILDDDDAEADAEEVAA